MPIYLGPLREAEQVVAVLRGQGLTVELVQQAGGWQPWGAASPFDARVMVPVGEVPRARQLLRRHPRWKPVDERTDRVEAERNYRLFVLVASGLLLVAAIAIAVVLLKP